MRHQREQRDRLGSLLPEVLGSRLKAPVGVILGSPLEAAGLVERLALDGTFCYQMDLYQAGRLEEVLSERGLKARVVCLPDLWDVTPSADDLPADSQQAISHPRPATLIYPVPQGGERGLKIDMVEQAYHALAPGGVLAVLSPFEKDQFFPGLLKKAFGKVHAPMAGGNALLWCQRGDERPRRRHEIVYQVRFGEESVRFTSRPGVFSYGRMDDGARALMEAVSLEPGQSLLDLGCGVGTNGVLAAILRKRQGFTGFLDSNQRAAALARLNAQNAGLTDFEVQASAHGEGFGDRHFDVVLANPPYFAQLSIAERFIAHGKAALNLGGTLYLVTKQVNQVGEMLQTAFEDLEAEERRGYMVFRAG